MFLARRRADAPAPLAQRRRYVVVAADASDLRVCVTELVTLVHVSEQVCLVVGAGDLPRKLQDLGPSLTVIEDPRLLGERWLRPSPRQRLSELARRDRQDDPVTATLDCADAVIVVGDRDAAMVAQLSGQRPQLRLVEVGEIAQEITRIRLHLLLDPDSPVRRRLTSRPRLKTFTSRVAALPRPLEPDLAPGLLQLVHLLMSSSSFEPSKAAAATLAEIPRESLSPVDRVRYDATLALATLTTTAEMPATYRPAVRGALQVADHALAEHDLETATEFTHLALRLLFHRELHADRERSPLVDAPREFLQDWHDSAVGALLARQPAPPLTRSGPPAPHDTDPTNGPAEVHRRERVLVLPGSYPAFCQPIIRSLSQVCDVTVLDLSERPMFRGLGIQRDVLALRLRHAVRADVTPSQEIADALAGCDTAFVDWADRGAVMTTMCLPPGTPLTLRIHSMDALAPWVHLIDWSRVNDLIFVSHHLKTVVERLLGDRLAQTRRHVIPNVIEPTRTTRTAADGSSRRIVMIGWGQRVKDPLWALEVLARLRHHDPAWELVLVGHPFDVHQSVATRDYAQGFEDRLSAEDIRGSVEVMEFTPDLTALLASCAFVLSASRRESFGVGLVEAAASGLVPVVRNWPMFAELDGARQLFPQDWVVDSVDEAVARFTALCQEPAWSRASAEAMRVVEDRFDDHTTLQAYHEVVLGGRTDI